MRFAILILLCGISLSASAQWWHIDLKKHERYPPLTLAKNRSVSMLRIDVKMPKPKLYAVKLSPSVYSLEMAEASVMKTAQHNMRFRVYNEASYNFSELAQLYTQQNRLSEAKWFYLQSNIISREENDDKHTIANLMALAMVKVCIGDFDSSQQDLAEAKEMAKTKGFQSDLLQVEKEIKYIQDNKATFIKTEIRYAEAVENELKAGQ